MIGHQVQGFVEDRRGRGRARSVGPRRGVGAPRGERRAPFHAAAGGRRGQRRGQRRRVLRALGQTDARLVRKRVRRRRRARRGRQQLGKRARGVDEAEVRGRARVQRRRERARRPQLGAVSQRRGRLGVPAGARVRRRDRPEQRRPRRRLDRGLQRAARGQRLVTLRSGLARVRQRQRGLGPARRIAAQPEIERRRPQPRIAGRRRELLGQQRQRDRVRVLGDRVANQRQRRRRVTAAREVARLDPGQDRGARRHRDAGAQLLQARGVQRQAGGNLMVDAIARRRRADRLQRRAQLPGRLLVAAVLGDRRPPAGQRGGERAGAALRDGVEDHPRAAVVGARGVAQAPERLARQAADRARWPPPDPWLRRPDRGPPRGTGRPGRAARLPAARPARGRLRPARRRRRRTRWRRRRCAAPLRRARASVPARPGSPRARPPAASRCAPASIRPTARRRTPARRR